MTIEDFCSSLDGLEKDNRWLWLGIISPWKISVEKYGQKLNKQKAGVGAKPARMVIASISRAFLTIKP